MRFFDAMAELLARLFAIEFLLIDNLYTILGLFRVVIDWIVWELL